VADWIKRMDIALPQSRLSLDLNQTVPSACHVCYKVMMLNLWLLRISLAWLALLVVAATYVLMIH